MGTRSLVIAAALAALAAAACKPDLGAPPSLVDGTRYLGVVSEPAEARPGEDVVLHAIVAGVAGAVADDAPASWAICRTPRPLSQNNVVSDDCVFEGQQTLPDKGLMVAATLPGDACQLYGPDPPPTPPGAPALRPVDPDVTGGYYQPVRTLLQIQPGDYIAGFARTRITCNLADAPIDVATEFRQRYHANTNPVIGRVLISLDGATSVDVPADVPAGATVTLLVRWTAASAETFPVFDPATRTLVDHREALRVSWFATDGEFDHDHTGAGEDDPATVTDNGWTAPVDPGVVHLWVVLRDSRGGTDYQAFDLTVTP
jgi:hypothetical protein